MDDARHALWLEILAGLADMPPGTDVEILHAAPGWASACYALNRHFHRVRT